MTRIAVIILASLSVIAGARGDDTTLNLPYATNLPVMCCVGGSCIFIERVLCLETPGAIIGYHDDAVPQCASGWLPVTVGGQTWCARELRAPGGQ